MLIESEVWEYSQENFLSFNPTVLGQTKRFLQALLINRAVFKACVILSPVFPTERIQKSVNRLFRSKVGSNIQAQVL